MKKGLLIALAAMIADQVHKYVMLHVVGMIRPKVIEVTSFFNLVMVWNHGVSFGMFNRGAISAYQPGILTIISLVIVAGLLFWLKKSAGKWQVWGVGLVIGGALGNVIDRVVYGAVADFLDFHIAAHHWPAFNIADSCICVGVFILVVESFFDAKKKENVTSGD